MLGLSLINMMIIISSNKIKRIYIAYHARIRKEKGEKKESASLIIL